MHVCADNRLPHAVMPRTTLGTPALLSWHLSAQQAPYYMPVVVALFRPESKADCCVSRCAGLLSAQLTLAVVIAAPPSVASAPTSHSSALTAGPEGLARR